MRADFVLFSSNIFTSCDKKIIDGGIAIENSTIAAIDSREEIVKYVDKDTQVYNFENQMIVPGFIDAHIHYLVSSLVKVGRILFIDGDSEKECVESAKELSKNIPKDQWIITQGWYLPKWKSKELPTKASLDKVFGDQPVSMQSADGHTLWVNSEGLRRLKLDKQKLPNISNINPNYLGRENDPENTYSIPYMFASTVIAINKDKVSDKITSYKDLLNSKYKDSMVVVEDPRALVAMAAMATGHDVNDASDSALKDDGEYLKKLMPNIHAFNGDSPKTLMINGECSIGLIYGAEVALAQEQNPSIQAVYPEEGVYLGADMLMITDAAKNKENAYNFVNYILDSKVSAEISKIFPYINPNKGAQEYLPDYYKQNILKNVPSEVFSRARTLKDLGEDNSKIVDLFIKVKDSK